MPTSDGLRERKKQQTRALIAQTSARLFAQRGYENVSVNDVARAADVAEQTVYNYFPSKQHLVLDRDDELQTGLAISIRTRTPGTSPARAIHGEALALLAELRVMSQVQVQGGLGYLAAKSPALRRLSLEMTDRHADAIAAVLSDEDTSLSPALAKIQGTALAWIFQTITDHTGRRALDGLTPDQIADELEPIITEALTSLDGWLATTRARR